MKLYHQHNIKSVNISDTSKNSRDIQIWLSLMKQGVSNYIDNADCELKLIVDENEDLYIPVVT